MIHIFCFQLREQMERQTCCVKSTEKDYQLVETVRGDQTADEGGLQTQNGDRLDGDAVVLVAIVVVDVGLSDHRTGIARGEW